jgi:hypothetical protein
MELEKEQSVSIIAEDAGEWRFYAKKALLLGSFRESLRSILGCRWSDLGSLRSVLEWRRSDYSELLLDGREAHVKIGKLFVEIRDIVGEPIEFGLDARKGDLSRLLVLGGDSLRHVYGLCGIGLVAIDAVISLDLNLSLALVGDGGRVGQDNTDGKKYKTDSDQFEYGCPGHKMTPYGKIDLRLFTLFIGITPRHS